MNGRTTRTVDEVHRRAARRSDQKVGEAVRIRGLLEQDHKDKADCQCVGDVRQEEDRLVEVPQFRDRVESHRDQQRDPRRKRNRDDDQDKSVLEGLQEISVPQHIGEVVIAYAEIGLGSEVVSLFHGVDDDVEQRIDHEDAEEDRRREQIQPGFRIILIHGSLLP